MLLVTLGDLSLDIVISATAPTATGSDVGGTIAFRVGGSAANVARAAASLGGNSVFVGAVGDDELGRRLVAMLEADGVRPVVTFIRKVPTARIAVLVGPDGERSFVTARGAADRLAPSDVAGIPIPHGERAWSFGLHVPMYSLLHEPIASAAADTADAVIAAGGLVSVDLASAEPLRAFGAKRARDAIQSIHPDLIFANEDEAAAVGGRLNELAPGERIIIKQGPRGCQVGSQHVPTEPMTVDDTTGAGDAFDAGFLVALLGEPPCSLIDAARAGHAAARELLTAPRRELEL